MSCVLMNIEVKQVLVNNLGSPGMGETAEILTNICNWKNLILEYKKNHLINSIIISKLCGKCIYWGYMWDVRWGA